MPRYHARDVAVVRGLRSNAVVVLGSATPSIESYYNALNGKYQLLELPERADNAKLPTVAIVDVTKERKRVFQEIKEEVQKSGKEFPKRLPDTSISKTLYEEIGKRLVRKEGIILLQNRRGFSHVVECHECGYVERCDSCDVSLTYHLAKKHLRCHYCGFVKRPPAVCPKCQCVDIRMHAFGTQQVHEELKALFPAAVTLRMDRDTTSRKGAHDDILTQFGEGSADILLGTQMVAKGLDFPRVTLVGVISADTQMLLPDFRASEMTYQLLTQVSGRAGRSTLAGEVVIQTMQPMHYCLKHVVSHSYRGFYDEEVQYRKELDYPPFSRIVLAEFSGMHEPQVQHHADRFGKMLDAQNGRKAFRVLGPADAAIPKIRDLYRKHVLIKDIRATDPTGQFLRTALAHVLREYESSQLGKNKNVRMVIDVDPQGMM
jgi:primosomal protein N' (replication factor Y)